MKACSRCKQSKPLTEFWKDRSKPDGRQHVCKECERSRKRNDHYKERYGISEATAKDMKEAGCRICGTHEGTLCIDHDHETGEVRGVLCHNCNVSLGHYERFIRLNLMDSVNNYLKGGSDGRTKSTESGSL